MQHMNMAFVLRSPWTLCLVFLVASQSVYTSEACPWIPLQHKPEPTCAISQPSRDAAWEGPHHCVGRYCIYSNRQFGGGVSLATTEGNAKIVKQLASSLEDPGGPSKYPPYYTAEVPGKGRGAIANRTIRRGEQIMSQPVVLLTQLDLHVKMREKYRKEMYTASVQKLPAARRRAFLNQTGDTVADIVDNNCFRMEIDGTNEEGYHLGCFLDVSLLNHDCRPNTQYQILNLTLHLTAVRPISPGTELTISYIDAAMPRSERQARLEGWGFTCTCPQCLLPASSSAASDARIHRIVALRDALDNPASYRSAASSENSDGGGDRVEVTAETGKELVRLYQEERLEIYVAKARVRSALNLALFGEVEAAREEAARAAEELKWEVGEESQDWKSMRLLAEAPERHWTWGVREARGGR